MPKLQQLVSYIRGLHLIAQALSEPGLKNLLHHIDALEGGIGDARSVIYSLVHLIALVLPAQCWVNLGVGWQCQGWGTGQQLLSYLRAVHFHIYGIAV